MFRVSIPVNAEELFALKQADVDQLLPSGYSCIRKASSDNFIIFLKAGRKQIGRCKLDLSGLMFEADEQEEGGDFWLAFGKKYPDLNPARIRFAIVSETDGFFRLENQPTQLPGESLEKVERYAKVGACYLVKFFVGHLDDKELLVVLKMQAILPDSSLGEDLGEAKLPLWGE